MMTEEQLEEYVQSRLAEVLNDPKILQDKIIESQKKILALQADIAADAPKVALHDQFIRTDKQFSITDLARHYGVQPTKHLIPYLRLQGYLLSRDGCVPTSKAIQAGIMLERENVLDGVAHPQAVVTAEMFDRWARIIENMKAWRDGK